jgi:hypothetical protein
MFGFGKKKAGAIDKASAIKKAAEKGIFLADESTTLAPIAASTESASPAPSSPEPATQTATAAPSPKAPAAKAPEPKPTPKPAPKPIPQPAAPVEIRFSNGEEYIQFARRRPGANMKSFLDMAKQVRPNS